MKLHFMGAAKMVTGSCYLLEVAEKKILIDCGMFQGSKAVRALNEREFMFDPAAIDSVLLTHAHVDHCGLIPRLSNMGFKGLVYATKSTVDLCAIMLPDSAHIQESDAEIANRKGKRAGKKMVEPLYTVDDAMRSLQHFVPIAYGADLYVTPEIRVVYRDAGHILGSAMLEVFVTENDEMTKLVFSGDLGQPKQPIIKEPTIIDGADYVIVESTYGNRLHEFHTREDKLVQVVNDTVERGGNVVIPSFAVGRTQEMLYYLYKLWREGRIPNTTVIVDSPLAIAATKIFAENIQDYDEESAGMLGADGSLPQMPHLMLTKTSEESKMINDMPGTKIILSASGMADAGRILHHLKHNLWNPDSSVLFVGYQAEESMGRRLIDGVKRVKIMGEVINVKARIRNIDGFSAHADRNQILDWLKHVANPKPANIFFVHGEEEAATSIGKAAEETFGVSAYVPGRGDTVTIHGREFAIDAKEPVIEPAIKDLEDYLSLVEFDYREIRKTMLKNVSHEPQKLHDTKVRLEKAWRYFRKLMNDM